MFDLNQTVLDETLKQKELDIILIKERISIVLNIFKSF